MVKLDISPKYPAAMPNPADNIIKKIGCIFFICNKITIKNITAEQINENVPKTFHEKPSGKKTVFPTDTAAAAIRPITAGFNPVITPCTYLLLLNLAKNRATINIMTNEGRTTPKVAQNAPKTPPVSEPIYVDIFIANGPGVLSLTATKFTISSEVIQPFDKISD